MLNHLTTRRLFLQSGLTMLAAGPTVPLFLEKTVLAMADPLDAPRTQRPSGKDGKILVVLQLSGGNDGMSMVVPYADDLYHKARPAIGHTGSTVLKVNDAIGLHPGLGPLMKLYEQGRMALVQGVGYPNPNRSHFRSMDIWHSAQPEVEHVTSGWIGRYFDNTCMGMDPHVGISVGQTLPLAMQGNRVTPLAFERAENYKYNGPDKQGYKDLNESQQGMEGAMRQPATQPGAARLPVARPEPKHVAITPASQLDFLHRTAMDAQLSSDEILRITRGHATAANYPQNEFGQGLRTIAAMIAGGLPTRVYYVSLGGFDTHANQRPRHDRLMADLAQGVAAFFADLAAQKNDDRVLMMSFSEFGRRVEQNFSGGTDHGAAAPVMLFGPALKPGVVGAHPSLKDLDHGDLKFATDFRSVYATILQNWLETPSKPILGQQFSLLPLMA